MTFTITDGATTIEPWDRIGFRSSSESTTVLHQMIDGTLDASLGVDLPRAGELELLFLTEAAAEAARQALAVPAVWTATDTYATVSFTFVRQGRLDVEQQENRLRWKVTVGYQELSS